jgi:hypothetical protein
VGFFWAILISCAPLACYFAVLRYSTRKWEQNRADTVYKVAASMGMEYSPSGEWFREQLASFDLIKSERESEITNVVYGETEECRISIFDFNFVRGTGEYRMIIRLTAVAVESPRLMIPDFRLRPLDFLERCTGLKARSGISFADNLPFSKKFLVEGTDEVKIRKLFDRPLQEAFLERTGYCVEALPGLIVYYNPGFLCKAEKYPSLIEDAYQFFGMMVDR